MANQRAARVLGLVSLLFAMQHMSSHAFEYKVGGSQGWTLPADPSAAAYNHWAEKSRFQVGDSLLFVYSSDHDSVLRVTKEDYENCNTDKPLDKFTGGHTVYKFTQSGPYYFISGVADNCRKNEKLIVVVMAERNKNGSNGTAEVPSPPPTEATSPPSPAPSGEESPAPPPEDADAPSQESSPPKNGVSSVAAGIVGTIAVFFGSSLAFLAF